MRIAESNWMQVESYLANDDRAVIPLGSTEQHAYLSLATDSILAERVAVEAAAPLGVAVFPALTYGITPYFLAYPGTLSLRVSTYVAIVRDMLDSLAQSGLKRIVLVNGHGGNAPAGHFAIEWTADPPGVQVKLHGWWRAPRTWAKVHEIDNAASHASWMENFPWTRLAGVTPPAEAVALAERGGGAALVGMAARAYYGAGNFMGLHPRPDADILALLEVAVAEPRDVSDNI